ncbi:MAG: flagellar hook-associated protein FlgK, partial [Myxococcota bacterium]
LERLLRMGGNGLSAHQQRLSTTQNNISNALTPGYRRQTNDLATLGGRLGASGQLGVTTTGRRSIDAPLVDRWIPYERGRMGNAQTRYEIASLTESTMSTSGTQLQEHVAEFFTSLRQLSADPGSSIIRRDVVAKGQTLADGFRQAAEALQQVREGVRAQTEVLVEDINGKLDRVASLDRQITSGLGSPEIIDERDRLVSDLATSIGVRVVGMSNGGVSIVTASGRALVEGGQSRALSIATNADEQVEVLMPDGQPLARPGGQIGAMIDSDREVVGRTMEQLDTLARNFADAVNVEHSAGVALDGSTGRDFFASTGTPTGAAATFTVNAQIIDDPLLFGASDDAALLPGGNDAVLNMIDIQESAIVGTDTFAKFVNEISSDIAQQVVDAEGDEMSTGQSLAQLENMQASTSGVSMEEEMIAMAQAKNAFEASSRIIDVGNELFDTVFNLVR